ncbi:MAG: membrane dipeptidase [Enterobacterales bacterium]|nr:membrane dipeptidase [Enterobacterales bacterium]
MLSPNTLSKGKKFTLVVLGILILGFLSARFFLPTLLDKKFNSVLNDAPYMVTEQGAKLYDSLDFIADLHSDVLLWSRDINKEHDFGHEDIPRMLKAKVSLQAFTMVNKVPYGLNFDKNTADSDQLTIPFILQGRPIKSWFDLTERVVVQSAELEQFARLSNGKLRVIKFKQDFEQYLVDRKNNKNITAGFLGIEGAQALKGDMKNLDIVYAAGVRMIGLTHFYDNAVGGSAHGVNKGGITEFGKKLVLEMEKRKIFVDLSHASEQLVDDVLSFAKRPILISHTGVKATCDNIRNLSDKHLKQIAATGGLVGIAMFKQAICGTKPMDIAKAIKYTVDLIGANHVALGSDFDGAIASVFDVTGLPQIVDALLKLSVSEQDIALIMGENVKRVLLESLPDKE